MMWQTITALVRDGLGLDLSSDELGFSHMAWRALVTFPFAVLLVRMGCRRLLGGNAGIDVMLVVILGSVLSRAINGQAAFFPTLGVSALLIGLHRLFAFAAVRYHWISLATKGSDVVLVRSGVVDRRAMRRAEITEDDLLESIRTNGRVASVAQVKEARLERNGSISVIVDEQTPAGKRLRPESGNRIAGRRGHGGPRD